MAIVKVDKTVSHGNFSIAKSTQHTVQTVIDIEETVADSVTDQEHLVAIDISALKAFCMSSDVAMTVETNSGGSPQETFSLSAGQQIVWQEGDTAIFAGDVTALYLTNASGSAGTFRAIIGTNV